MNRPLLAIRRISGAAAAVLAAAVLAAGQARAGMTTYTGHDYVSVTSAITVSEADAIRFGNFAVATPGGADASIVMSDTGARTSTNGVSTTIALLNGGFSDAGSQGPGLYNVSGAGAGATLYVSFTDHTGAAITSANPVVLTGPAGSGTFDVDTLTFNQSGSDVNGPYILADAGGNAAITVGATLHTVSGVSTYAPGTYRGTFDLVLSY